MTSCMTAPLPLEACSQGSEASTSDSKEQGCASSGNVRSTSTLAEFFPSIGPASPVIPMSGSSAPMEENGLSQSMFSVEDSPARTSQPLDEEQESTESEAACSSRSSGLLAHFDPDTYSWRTWQRSLSGDLTLFSESWPYAGTMRNGIASARPPSGRSTDAIGCSSSPIGTPTAYTHSSRSKDRLKGRAPTPEEVARGAIWPTPCSTQRECNPEQFKKRMEFYGGKRRAVYLQDAVKYWPTPRAEEGRCNASPSNLRRDSVPLGAMAQMFPTPISHDAKSASPIDAKKHHLAGMIMFPTPSSQEPGISPERLVDKDGNPPEHWNQRLYDKETGRLCQKGLSQVARMWRTPSATDGARGVGGQAKKLIQGITERDSGQPIQKTLHTDVLMQQMEDQGYSPENLPEVVSGQLNPTWVEWLMGFPLGWTDLSVSGTPSSPRSQSMSEGASLSMTANKEIDDK